MTNCPFCEKENLNSRIILKTQNILVFPTNIPIVPGHVLICPIRHVKYLEDLSPEEKLELEEVRVKIKQALQKTFGATGFNYAWNEETVAGQSVPHLHLHVLPRKEGDVGIYEYDPRKFLYRPGSREESPEIELQEVADLVKQNL